MSLDPRTMGEVFGRGGGARPATAVTVLISVYNGERARALLSPAARRSERAL